MSNDFRNALVVKTADLRTVAELVTMRFPLRAPESRRVVRLRTLLALTAEVNRTLSTFLEHALVHCHGTAGTSDLSADTVALDHALRAFSTEIASIAQDYDEAVNKPCVSELEESAAELASMRDLSAWQPRARELPAS